MRSLMSKLPVLALAAGLATPACAADDGWQKQVADELGRPGIMLPSGVYRVGLARTDLRVTLDGVAIKPTFALGSYLAFHKTGSEVMVMGDLVLTQDEVNPVMKKLIDGGIEITALHNHLLRAAPSTMYMHVLGRGEPGRLAGALRAALVLSKTPLVPPTPAGAPAPLRLETAPIDQALGAKGTVNGGVYGFDIPRAETISEGGVPLPSGMGTGTVINFQPTDAGKAAITGDFVLIAKEVNPVLKALRDHGIEVTAVHSHMLEEQPRLFFVHFWGNGNAVKLAEGLKGALSKVNRPH